MKCPFSVSCLDLRSAKGSNKTDFPLTDIEPLQYNKAKSLRVDLLFNLRNIPQGMMIARAFSGRTR